MYPFSTPLPLFTSPNFATETLYLSPSKIGALTPISYFPPSLCILSKSPLSFSFMCSVLPVGCSTLLTSVVAGMLSFEATSSLPLAVPSSWGC